MRDKIVICIPYLVPSNDPTRYLVGNTAQVSSESNDKPNLRLSQMVVTPRVKRAAEMEPSPGT